MYQCFDIIDTGIETQSLLTAKLRNNPGSGKYIHSRALNRLKWP